MAGFFDLFNVNKYAKYFTKDRFEQDIQQKQETVNSQGIDQEQLDVGRPIIDSSTYNSYQGYNGYHAGMTSINIQFEQYFISKAQRVSKYREMSFYPEISDALDIISDDGIVESTDGDMVELEIKEELPEHIEEEIRNNWEYLLEDVFCFNEVAWELFRKWLVDGELYIELILNSQGSDMIGIKVLPAHTMSPIYEDGKIIGYVQSIRPNDIISDNQNVTDVDQKDSTVFDKDQIVYINYGITGRNRYDIRGFLEPSVRIYNQLKNLEDAVVIYRIVRAPERRIWNVQVGRMPKSKAEEYIRGMMQRYRKRIKYDPSTGAMDSAQNVQAMTEDFWFAKNQDGEGTSVDVLAGGCFDMDTKVSLLDGRELSIRDIKTEMDNGNTLWTYSCHPETGEVVPGLINWAGVTHKLADVLKLTLNNNEEIICTYDHKFPMYNKGFVRADELVENDILIPTPKHNESKIVKIEYLKDKMEVGTLTIDSDEKYHNYHTFALSCGVFTKNSNLGEMDDVRYFLKKLYKNLKLPSTRWNDLDGTQIYSTGKSGEITREEIKFANFIQRLQKRFKYILFDPFITLLRLRGIDQRYVDYSLYNLKFTESNLYKKYKELELLESRFAILGAIDTYIYKPEENPNGYFADEFVLREWFMMTDDEYNKNQTYLEKQKLRAKDEMVEAGLGADDTEEDGLGGSVKPDSGFGGGGGAGKEQDFGAELGAEENLEPEPPQEETEPEAPAEESVSFKIDGNQSNILKEYLLEDLKIINSKKKLIK